jgi:hypothetical protein
MLSGLTKNTPKLVTENAAPTDHRYVATDVRASYSVDAVWRLTTSSLSEHLQVTEGPFLPQHSLQLTVYNVRS